MKKIVLGVLLILLSGCLGNFSWEADTNAETFTPYNFQGGEHFEFNVYMNVSGTPETGIFTWDIGQITQDNRFPMTFNLSMGNTSCYAQITSRRDSVAQLNSMGQDCGRAFALLASTIYSPYWAFFSSQGLKSWDLSIDDLSMSFQREGETSYAGLNCINGVMYIKESKVMQICASKDLGLGIKTVYYNPDNQIPFYDTELIDYSLPTQP
jgi:hypothetical protein